MLIDEEESKVAADVQSESKQAKQAVSDHDDCSVSILEGILEEIDHLTDEKNKSNKNKIVVIDGSLSYNNIEDVPMETSKHLLSTSIHTTKSNESMEIARIQDRDDKDDGLQKDDLSFHVSQVDVSNLQDMTVSDHHDGPSLETLELIGRHLQGDEEEEKREATLPLIGKTCGHRLVAFLLVSAAMAAFGFLYKEHGTIETSNLMQSEIDNSASIMSSMQSFFPLSATNGKAMSIKVGATGVSFSLEDSKEVITHGSWEATKCMMIILFILLLCKGKEASSIMSEKALVKHEKAIAGYDLSVYQSLKYKDLRKMLRERNIKIYGKKAAMAKRLAAVYNAELETLTVTQLRRKLKAKNFNQTGRKHQIIRTLVESGI